MKNGDITKLIKILDNNKKSNILLLGISGSIFENAIIIPSTIPSAKLGIGIDDSGNYIKPSWLQELELKTSEDKILIVIESLDKISTSEQDKFYGMLKNKGINGYKFPDNCQIICTSKSSNPEKINARLWGLCIIYKN